MKTAYGEEMYWFDDSDGERISWSQIQLWVEKIIRRYVLWRGLHPNFSGKDLSGVILDVFDLKNCNFSDCVFDNSNSEREFNLDFSNSRMHRVKMSEIYLFNTIFHHADLEQANFKGAFLQGVNFSNAKLNGANLADTDWCSEEDAGGNHWAATLACNAHMVGADLTNANLAGADLSGADLSGAVLVNTNLSGANLSDTLLAGADISGANFTNANLTNSTLQR